MTEEMRIDVAIMNPPYDGNLQMKISEKDSNCRQGCQQFSHYLRSAAA